MEFVIKKKEDFLVEIGCPCGNVCSIRELEVSMYLEGCKKAKSIAYRKLLCPKCNEVICSYSIQENARVLAFEDQVALFSEDMEDLKEIWPEIKEWNDVVSLCEGDGHLSGLSL